MPSLSVTWSDEVCAIHEVPPGTRPTVEQGLAFYVPEHLPAISEAFERCLCDGTPFDLELQIVTARGKPVWVRALGEAVYDRTGRICKVQGAFQDISRSREMSEQNKALAESLVETLESMGDAFFTLDRSWNFTYVNRQAELVLERSRHSILGRCVWEEFPEAVGSRFQVEYERALQEMRPVELEEFYPPLNRWFHVKAYPSGPGLAVYFRDCTETVEARTALQRMNEELERRVESRTRELRSLASELESFSYSVAHDLRAPLASISGFSKILLDRYSSALDEMGQRYLHKVCGAAQRMDQMISAVLELAKLPNRELRRQPFDITQAARDFFVRQREAEPGREVDEQVEPDLVVNGDPVLLAQALENLLSNAWKFTAKVPRAAIRVGRDRQGSEDVYFVEDNGAGFDMATAHRLFEVFSRQHHDSEFPGAGVGLATVKRIVRRHGGRVWMESAAGVGTKVSFTLAQDLPPPAKKP